VTDHAPRSTAARYALYQIPGWLLACAGAVTLYRWVDIPGWLAFALPLAWAIKDAVLYPLLRPAYELDHRPVIERLVGLDGVTVERLAPRGYVRVRGELWLAEPAATGPAIAVGHAVRVDAVRGTTLLVRPRPDTAP